MTGIYGWISTEPVTSDRMVLNSVENALPPTGNIISRIIRNNLVFGIKCFNKQSHSDISGSIATVINGSPTWKTSDIENYNKHSGDAATLIYVYKKYGVRFLEFVGGSFSLALFDPTNNTLILAVDRMGTFPLSYSVNNNGLIFSSSLASITKHPDISSTLDPQSIYNYVYFHFIPSPDTIYKNINKLEPATCLIYTNSRITIKKYWNPVFNDHEDINIQEESTRLLQILSKSVSKFKTEQVGTFLSGGLDSSTISGVLAKLSDSPINTYSIGFSAEGYDETPYSRIASEYFGTVSHEYFVTPDDIIEALPVVAHAYDEPFGNSSAIPALFCARLAYKHGTRFMLAGDGGDELFAGNERYAKQKLFELYTHFPLVLRKHIIEPALLGLPALKKAPLIRKLPNYIEKTKIPIVERIDHESYNFFQDMNPEHIFTSDFLNSIDTNTPLNLLQKTYNEAPTDSYLNSMLYLDWKFTLADNDIRKVNQMCEISGIQVRYPMLDDELVEFSSTIPPQIKLKNLKLRYFFKYSMKDFLPDVIINKSKHGFGLPFGVWLKSNFDMKEFVYSGLDDLKMRNIISTEFIKHIIQTHQTGHASYYGTMIWALLMLEHWFKQHDL